MPSESLPVLHPYDQIGGEPALRALVARFYQHMGTRPEVRAIHAMHEDLPRAADRLFAFLSGWLGGPPLYQQQFGPPFLRARHLPFSIGTAERDQWMICMDLALAETVTDPALRERLRTSFYALATHMQNRPSDETL